MSYFEILILAAVAAVVFGLVIAGMAVGVILSNRRIKGSCGGLATMRDADGRSSCMACGGSPENCDEADRISEACGAHPDHETAGPRAT